MSRYTKYLVSNSKINRKSYSSLSGRGLSLYFSRSTGAQSCQPGSGQLMKPGHTSLFLLRSRSENSVILRKATKRETEAAVIYVCGFMGQIVFTCYLISEWYDLYTESVKKNFTKACEKCE